MGIFKDYISTVATRTSDKSFLYRKEIYTTWSKKHDMIKSVKTVARRKNMNECGGRSLGKPLCNAVLNKALRMPGGGGVEVPAQEGARSGSGEQEDDEKRRARQP